MADDENRGRRLSGNRNWLNGLLGLLRDRGCDGDKEQNNGPECFCNNSFMHKE
jgi:hypothetical protein